MLKKMEKKKSAFGLYKNNNTGFANLQYHTHPYNGLSNIECPFFVGKCTMAECAFEYIISVYCRKCVFVNITGNNTERVEVYLC